MEFSMMAFNFLQHFWGSWSKWKIKHLCYHW